MNNISNAQIIGKTSCGNAPSISCTDCVLRGSCFPTDMTEPNVSDFNAIVQRARPLHKGDHIYRTEQPFNAIYAVRSGAFKAYTVSADGEEQVAQFYLPGQVFGLDGLSRNRYAMSVVALETSAVCMIPFGRLQALSARNPALQHHLFRMLSDVIVGDQDLITQLGKHTAERRVAAFLLRLSQHQAGRKYSASKIRLPMTRTDISCYLGLTVETVSRIFGRFQKIGLLSSDNRDIEILDLDWLGKLAAGQPASLVARNSSLHARALDSVDAAAAVVRRAPVKTALRAAV